MKFHRRALLLLLIPVAGIAAAGRLSMPIEVVGQDGAMASIAVDLPSSEAARVRSLWMQIHGLSYSAMVSVQLNAGAWLPLSNDTVAVAEPGRSYGGIGGGFATLRLTLPLPSGAAVAGSNTIRFRFNHSDGLVSGFRVLAFNLLRADGTMVLPAGLFSEDDPNTWTPPRPAAADIAAGRTLWYNAPLVVNNQQGAAAIKAHCADCHAQDGRDLKYFNFSNASIAARAQFHGLSLTEGEQIASYIRSLPLAHPGRPWNPPYQPGPGLDAQPVANWAAGAGFEWVLDKDEASLSFIFGSANPPFRITPESFRPDGNLNPREIPIALQLPDWNHWLPRVHPLDAWGADFPHSDLNILYSGGDASLRARLASAQVLKLIATGDIAGQFEKWSKAQRKFLVRYQPRNPDDWTPDLSNKVYSTQLWQLVKAWELAQEFELEGRGREFFGPAGESRTWLNTIALAAAPAEENIPDGANGMGGSALNNEYFDNAWYELQILLNSGNHRHNGRQPVDWIYVLDRMRSLYKESRRAEPARVLVATIKAMQSADPRIPPDNQLRGWRPDDTVDPRIMVSSDWVPIFQPFDPAVRQAITEAMLTAWLDKNLKYRTRQYFTQGTTGRVYSPPKQIAAISGGNVAASAPQFEAAGVAPLVVTRLRKWGRAYSNMETSLHY